jgi:outer membrane protein
MLPRHKFAALAIVALTVAVTAQQATRPAAPAPARAIKVAVIDTERIMINSAAGKKALADLKRLQEQSEASLRKRAEELKALQKQITDGRLTFSQDKLAQLAKQYEDKEIAVRRLQDDAARELNKRKDDALAVIDASIMPVINRAGKELGYTLIFRKFESGLIFADESVDLTGEIIRRLDASAPAVKK